MKKVDTICDKMFGDFNMSLMRMFAWFFHKVFNTIYEKVIVDKAYLKYLANYDKKANGPLILIPTHRSYIDFLILSYIFFAFSIQTPMICAAQLFR